MPRPTLKYTSEYQLSFGIKIAARFRERDAWGDFHYADSLADALRRLGHSARIDFRGEWNNPSSAQDDVAIVLRGLFGYTPPREQFSILWSISHPDRVPYKEYGEYNCIFVASNSYASLLSIILDRPVCALLQCSDTTRFNFSNHTSHTEDSTYGLFVGNSRNIYREMVRRSIENKIDVDIFGKGWEKFVSNNLISGTNLPNRQLGQRYRSAAFVLNDHWQSMKDFGFVSNRAFDVVASGGRLISDTIHSLKTIFGDLVETTDNDKDFIAAVKKRGLDINQRRAGADYVKKYHSFDARAKDNCAAVTGVPIQNVPLDSPKDSLTSSIPRRTIGLILKRHKGVLADSAYIRLICPLTTDYAHSVAGLDVLMLTGPEDPQLSACDICIAQGSALRDFNSAQLLTSTLKARSAPLYVDIDETTILDDSYPTSGRALNKLIEFAEETWFSSEGLANLFIGSSPKSRVRRDNIDPRIWRNYKESDGEKCKKSYMHFVYMPATPYSDDLDLLVPVFERLAKAHPGQMKLTLIGVDPTLKSGEWLETHSIPSNSYGYPDLARHITQELSFDVGLAPLQPTWQSALISDRSFLQYSAMGLLSVVSEASVLDEFVHANLAVGCSTCPDAWYSTLSDIIKCPSDYSDMRRRAVDNLWSSRNTLDNHDLANFLSSALLMGVE